MIQHRLIKHYRRKGIERPHEFIARSYNDSRHNKVLMFESCRRERCIDVLEWTEFKKQLNEVEQQWLN